MLVQRRERLDNILQLCVEHIDTLLQSKNTTALNEDTESDQVRARKCGANERRIAKNWGSSCWYKLAEHCWANSACYCLIVMIISAIKVPSKYPVLPGHWLPTLFCLKVLRENAQYPFAELFLPRLRCCIRCKE